MKTILILTLLLTISAPAFTGWWPFGPKNYEECIEDYVSDAGCERAAKLMVFTCVAEFKKGKNSKKYRAYFTCLRDKVKNTQTTTAANILAYDCKTKHGM